MQCHYCDREAAFEAEHGGVVVGLCADHFRDRIEELAEDEGLTALRDRIDVESSE
ncbi:MAG: hypothetical protein PPP55_00055 [Halorubrum sp.]